MRDLSLHLLDLAQNSITAGASLVTIRITVDDAGMLISEVLPLSKVCIVTDENVNRLFGKRLEESLEAAGFDVTKAVFPAGEETKSISALSDLLEYLAEKQASRTEAQS